jgi:hypothetical protein
LKLSFRSEDEIVADSRRLDALTALMPDGVIRERVGQYIVEARKGTAFDQRGDPKRFAGFVTEHFGVGPAQSTSRDSSGSPSAKTIAAESGIVARELTRDWVDSVLSAWRRLGRSASALELDNDFTPLASQGSPDAWKDWHVLRRRAVAALLSTAAVTAKDRDDIMMLFWSRLRDSLRPGHPVELPDRVDLVVRDDRHIFARPRS